MSHKRKGHLTTSGEWKKHLRPFGRKLYWGSERAAERDAVKKELSESAQDTNQRGEEKPEQIKINSRNLQP